MSKYLLRSVLLLLITYNSVWTQIDQPYPPLNLVSIPTAGTLPRGSFTFESCFINFISCVHENKKIKIYIKIKLNFIFYHIC